MCLSESVNVHEAYSACHWQIYPNKNLTFKEGEVERFEENKQ